MKTVDKKLDALIQAVEKLVANPVAPVAPIAPIAPVLPVAPVIQQNSGDHDILTSFRAEALVEFKNIKDTLIKIQESNETYALKSEFVEHLKEHAILRNDVDTLKTTVTKIWSYGVAGIFVVALIEFALRFIIK